MLNQSDDRDNHNKDNQDDEQTAATIAETCSLTVNLDVSLQVFGASHAGLDCLCTGDIALFVSRDE